MDKKDMTRLLAEAREAKKRSYSPYSHFSVGAALRSENGRIFKGCNVENASFSPTCCAERVALFSAVADGESNFTAIAVVGDSAPCMPCGVCRQVMSELCPKELEIIYENAEGEAESTTLDKLLPYGFELKKDLEKK